MTKFNVKLRQGNEEAVGRFRLLTYVWTYVRLPMPAVYLLFLLLLRGDEEVEVLLYCSLDGVSNVIYLSNNNNILPEEEEANECVWEKMSVRDSGKNCAMFEES